MSVVKVKPRFRGVSHQFAFFVSLAAGFALWRSTPLGDARLSVGVYVLSLSMLLGASALYHRPMWSPRLRAIWKRVDHAMIFILIAGTYTPLCLLALGGDTGRMLLAGVWISGGLGAVMAVLWPGRPRALSSFIYVAIGLAAVLEGPAIVRALDTTTLTLFALGGVFYIAGALVYAFRKPNPNPAVFGYHEVFHAMVVVACALHFAAITRIVAALPTQP